MASKEYNTQVDMDTLIMLFNISKLDSSSPSKYRTNSLHFIYLKSKWVRIYIFFYLFPIQSMASKQYLVIAHKISHMYKRHKTLWGQNKPINVVTHLQRYAWTRWHNNIKCVHLMIWQQPLKLFQSTCNKENLQKEAEI